MLQIILFCAYLNWKYPRSAVPIRPLIDRLLEEKHSAEWTSSEELYRLAFGPLVEVPPRFRA